MLCYGDRTYCSAPCLTTACSRNVTPEVTRKAEAIDLPIAEADYWRGCPEFRYDATRSPLTEAEWLAAQEPRNADES